MYLIKILPVTIDLQNSIKMRDKWPNVTKDDKPSVSDQNIIHSPLQKEESKLLKRDIGPKRYDANFCGV